ncbi:hypothetical protein A4X09_0g943 [Tilletia walkeri]|uniref:Tenascin-X n=1 Tax=Tilletia walkeri TaxID=117179 RepID=A0A8X7T8I8_9BASI|nr:hypothetical protein A4X09_0g943 [Tilletia walkeri]
MWSLPKANGPKFAIAVFVSLLLASAVASPTDRAAVARSPQPPNSGCYSNSECLSGLCDVGPGSSCTNPDGSYTDCSSDPRYNTFCSGYALGQTCANNGDCREGFCRSGKCTSSKAGDLCSEQYQCTGLLICSTDKKCSTPKNSTVYPDGICSANAQCKSGRCTADQLYKDDDGINQFTLYGRTPLRCDYLNRGQSGCRTFHDCKTGRCENGKCRAGKDGDSCIMNYNCEQVCGKNGSCFTPAANSGRQNEPCIKGDQCISGRCSRGYVDRPSLDRTNHSVQAVDTVCEVSQVGDHCQVNGDCEEGLCRSGVCLLVKTGDKCSASTQCASKRCDTSSSAGSTTRGTCVLANAGTECDNDLYCYSGRCVEPFCGYGYCGPPIDRCTSIAPGGTCRTSGDCDGLSGCSAEKKCRHKKSYSCKADIDCLSKNCVKGTCAAAVVKTTTSSTRSSSRTSTSRGTTLVNPTTHTYQSSSTTKPTSI